VKKPPSFADQDGQKACFCGIAILLENQGGDDEKPEAFMRRQVG
jgi:hypothetical protein